MSIEHNLIQAGFSKDDKFIASGSTDNYVYIWNTETGQVVNKLQGHQGAVNDVKF